MHRIILLRHGQSVWNLENRFTGWTDVPLSVQGEEEARTAGRLIAETGWQIDIAFTSLLKRAIKTLWLALEEMDRMWIPVVRCLELNERHYGALQGLNKAETAAEYGEEQVHLWRRGYAIQPPPLSPDDTRFPGFDPRYAALPPAELPLTESLADTVQRTVPWWEKEALPQLKSGRTLLIAAHGNSLRALVKHLDRIPDEEITGLNIPTGIPLVYELDNEFKVKSSRYLGDPAAAEAAAAAVAAQTSAPADGQSG